MRIRKYLSIFLIGFAFAIAGCTSDSSSGISDEDRLPDTDNDGIVDKHDPDLDGDGLDNNDPAEDDIDGDGTPDAIDQTPNGPGGEAPRAGAPCTSAKIKPPKGGVTGRLDTVSWELVPKTCQVTVNRTVVVTASAGGVTTESRNARLGKLTANIILPQDCTWSGTQSIAYDFSEIGTAFGDSSGDYTTSADATVGECVEPVIALSNIARAPKSPCSVTSTGAVQCVAGDASTCRSNTCFQLWANNRSDVRPLDRYHTVPTWSVEGASESLMKIYLVKDDVCKVKWEQLHEDDRLSTNDSYILVYRQGDTANWDLVKRQCLVKIDFNDRLGSSVGWENMPTPGNFVLHVTSGTNKRIIINSYSAGPTKP